MIFSLSKENNEFGKLSFALNSMLARINEDNQKLKQNIQSLEQANNQLVESQKKIVRAEKMGAVGRLSAGLAHEIGNPIGIVQGYLELLGDVELTPEERQQFSARAVKELERVNKMVRQLLDFSRTSSESENFVSIGKVCRDVVGMIRSQKTFSDLELVVDTYSGNDTVRIGYDELYQVLINCWFNSIDAIEDRGNGFAGRISISSSIRQSSSNPPFMEIQITDNGTGIPKDHLASVFDPFYTTKDVGKGTGLGLSISYSIIEAAGGVMEIESVHGEGTNILISLPKVALQENSALAQRSIANG
jgi:C4-dicarboxylate-specific signal transduction histidine kinase